MIKKKEKIRKKEKDESKNKIAKNPQITQK